ncbi:MAG: hypothetical protein LBL83_11535 [Clostridiales bacterium]|nr:hypothetical protein [Clostridiales bacterium]
MYCHSNSQSRGRARPCRRPLPLL